MLIKWHSEPALIKTTIKIIVTLVITRAYLDCEKKEAAMKITFDISCTDVETVDNLIR